MDIKKMLGDAYKDDMTVEELLKALEAVSEPGKSAEPTVSKSTFDKMSSELAEMKRKAKEKMSEEERAAQERKELEDRLLASEKAVARMKQERAFVDSGYDAKTAAVLAEALEKGDMEGFMKSHSEYMAETMKKREADIKADLLKATPKIPQGSEGAEPTEVSIARQAAQNAVASAKSAQSVFDHYK